MTDEDPLDGVADAAVELRKVIEDLNRTLGSTLVAALAGSRDSKAAERWARTEGPAPTVQAQVRLRAAHRVSGAIAGVEGEDGARVWFTGLNPVLGDVTPVIALREGRVREVVSAARAFLSGTWSA